MSSQDPKNLEDPYPGFCQSLTFAIGDLRERLRTRYERIFPGQKTLIENVLEEAESVAWCTPFPLLFLPDFAEARIARIATAG